MKLSILIPEFNEIRYLDLFTKNLKKSFKNENVEYIFINDGSDDGSTEWLKNYINSNKNDILINLKTNSGKARMLVEVLYS